MKSIWWMIAMLVLAAISLLANKMLAAQNQSRADKTGATSISQTTATTPQLAACR